MQNNEDRGSYFLSLLGKEQQANLGQVRRGLEIPRPQPTEAQLEEARNAECSEGLSVCPDGGA